MQIIQSKHERPSLLMKVLGRPISGFNEVSSSKLPSWFSQYISAEVIRVLPM